MVCVDDIRRPPCSALPGAHVPATSSSRSEPRASIRPGPPAAVERRMSAARAHDCRGDLHRIVAPTLVVRGEEDPFISTATAAWTVDQIKDAKLVLVPEAGHSLTRHHREGVAPIIRDFVLSHPI